MSANKSLSSFTLNEIAVRYWSAAYISKVNNTGIGRNILNGLCEDYPNMPKEKVADITIFIETFGKALEAFTDENY